MTCREATIQALVEIGISQERAELETKIAAGGFPGVAVLASEAPVRPGLERAFIEALKPLFRQMAAYPRAVQGVLQGEMGKQAQKN